MSESSMLQEWLARSEVAEAVQAERAARDQAQWSRMLSYWHPNSMVDISWFQGTGPAFVEASRKMYEAGVRSSHQMAPTLSRVQGNRALAETGCTIVLHGAIGGVPVFMTSYSRLFSRLFKHQGRWLLCGFRMVYDFDFVTPANASEHLLVDEDRLKTYRESYKYAAYILEENGQTPNPLLPGSDRPDLLLVLHDGEEVWLNETA